MPALKAENQSEEKQTDIGAVAIEISSLPNFLGQMKEKLYSQGGSFNLSLLEVTEIQKLLRFRFQFDIKSDILPGFNTIFQIIITYFYWT